MLFLDSGTLQELRFHTYSMAEPIFRKKNHFSLLEGPKTTYTTIPIAEKRSKGSKKGPFSLYIGFPRVPTRKWN